MMPLFEPIPLRKRIKPSGLIRFARYWWTGKRPGGLSWWIILRLCLLRPKYPAVGGINPATFTFWRNSR